MQIDFKFMTLQEMPSYILAKENYDLSKELSRKQKYNWATVILYYSAIMFAKTVFIKKGWLPLPQTHDAWIREIKNKLSEDASYNYQVLRIASHKSRYNAKFSLNINKNNYKEYYTYYVEYKKEILSAIK